MISVIVPIYNSEKYLNQCLTSLVKQTYSDLEIILVNDGSTDSSMNICEKFKKEDDRIILINKKNQGLVRARKDGARKATGEYITFIDADDWIDADTYDNLRDFKSDIIAYGLVEEYGYKIKKKTNKFKDGFYEKDKISDYIIPQMLCVDNFFEFGLLPNLVCKLIKRTLFLEMMEEVSNDVSVGEDVDFFYRLVFKAETLTIRSYCPYHYRQHSESMMRKKIDIESIKKLYFDLLTINGVKKKTEWEIQLNKYIMFVMLLKIPDKVVHLIREISEINGSVVIYGAGAFGKGIYTQLKQNKKIKELFIVDKQWKDLSKEKILIDNPERIADINPDKVIITMAPKGFGSENMSRVFMLKPADGIEGVKNAIITAVKDAGPNACPPMVVGVGIGGTFEKCAILAKKALTRPVGEHSAIPYVKELEEEMLEKINQLGIGPGGLGGTTTALAVNVNTYATHIAGLPVAVNICCHVNRHVIREV